MPSPASATGRRYFSRESCHGQPRRCPNQPPAERRAPCTDIVGVEPDVVAAEAFAAVNPRNNRKLQKDIAKLVRECPNARARYVFFNAPGFARGRHQALEISTAPGIEVWGIHV